MCCWTLPVFSSSTEAMLTNVLCLVTGVMLTHGQTYLLLFAEHPVSTIWPEVWPQVLQDLCFECRRSTRNKWDPERVLAAIDSNAKCPECEQAGMFKGAVYLEQVHQLVKQRLLTTHLHTHEGACRHKVHWPAMPPSG